MRFLLSLLACLACLIGFARAALAGCEIGAPNFTATDGRPLVHETASTYSNPNCLGYDVVDVTYKALSGLPGTYLSWADVDATTAATCSTQALSGKVWDMSSSPPVYKGELRSAGVWVTNRDTASNPGASVCHVPAIRFETSFGFTAGRKYRFALRAWRTSQKGARDFVFANAPLPTRDRGCGTVDGTFYCALIASSGGNTEDWYGWPSLSYRLKLESPDLKVTYGGDLLFQNGKFFQPSRTYQRSGLPNHGYSNAALVYKGNVSSLSAITCSDFTMLADVYAHPDYSYLDETTTASTAAGSSYCLLNARNNIIYKVRVEKSAPTVLVLGYKFDKNTGRAAWGCLDGMCDTDARLASQYMRYTTTDRDRFVRRQFELLHQSRYCIEAAFQRVLPVPLSMNLHGERLLADARDSIVFGLGGKEVLSVGFQGYHKAGTTRIEDARDIRFELHESTHAFNANLFASDLPSWLDEGLAIQTTRLDCGGNPDYLRDQWRAWSAGTTSPHAVGSEFFKRLETQYACGVDCAYGLWRALVDSLGADTSITNYEIKQVMEATLGRSLTPLFDALGIPFPVAGP